jgi:hypothetical protein
MSDFQLEREDISSDNFDDDEGMFSVLKREKELYVYSQTNLSQGIYSE